VGVGMSDLVEKVARAINSTAYAEHEESWAKDRWPDFLDAARIVAAAFLDAIAEPSAAQLDAGEWALFVSGPSVDLTITAKKDAGLAYRAMIAALRKEIEP
jgi:hypothetical protein